MLLTISDIEMLLQLDFLLERHILYCSLASRCVTNVRRSSAITKLLHCAPFYDRLFNDIGTFCEDYIVTSRRVFRCKRYTCAMCVVKDLGRPPEKKREDAAKMQSKFLQHNRIFVSLLFMTQE